LAVAGPTIIGLVIEQLAFETDAECVHDAILLATDRAAVAMGVDALGHASRDKCKKREPDAAENQGNGRANKKTTGLNSRKPLQSSDLRR